MNTKSPHKTITLNFTTLKIYEHFIVSTIKEGVLFDAPQLDQLQDIFTIYFADRQNDYTVNPVCYTNSNAIENMVGMAVLCYSEANYKTANFTKPFFRKPLEAFSTFEACKNWIEDLL